MNNRIRLRARWLSLLAFATAATLVITLAQAFAAPSPSHAGPSTDEPATMADYWNGTAQWTPYRDLSSAEYPETNNGGTHFTIVGDTWYWANRYVDWGKRCEERGYIPMGMQVRKSTDEGMTWSDPTLIVEPGTPIDNPATVGVDEGAATPGKEAAWGCIGTDGDLWFEPDDGPDGTWHFLFQCTKNVPEMKWNTCHAERAGADPMGPFNTPVGANGPEYDNPVVEDGAVWGKICDSPTDVCTQLATYNQFTPKGKTRGEGTFKVFRAKDEEGYYWVDFSGTAHPYWFNGIAKTKNFKDWIAGDPAAGVPADAVLYPGLADGWRETWQKQETQERVGKVVATPNGDEWVANEPPQHFTRTTYNVGFGAGTVFEETIGGTRYTYLLAESQDKVLGCALGQNWDLGLFRTTDIASNSWAQFPRGNPIFYSSKEPEALLDIPGTTENVSTNTACSTAYPQIFRDPSTGWIYLEISRQAQDKDNHTTFIYRLEKSRNLLKNGDFETADALHWTASGGIAHAVYRNTSASPDGTQHLEFNCGGPCTGAQALTQTVDVAAHRGERLEFGGTVATDGTSQSLTIRVRQLDAGGTVVKTDDLTQTIGNTYEGIQAATTIASNASKAEYSLVPGGPYNFCAGGLFASPGTGTVAFEPASRTCKKRWLGIDPLLKHHTGSAGAGGTWVVKEGDHPADKYMSFGPYQPNGGVGDRVARWRLKIDDNTKDANKVLTLDVYDATTGTALATRTVTRKMFLNSGKWQDFDLPYSISPALASHRLEFRAYWHGAGTVTMESVRQFAFGTYFAQHSLDPGRSHVIGAADTGGWNSPVPTAAGQTKTPGFLGYGPYRQFREGANLATFVLSVERPNPDPNKVVAEVQVFDATTQTVLERREVNSNIFAESLKPEAVEVPFTITSSNANHVFELRTFWMDELRLKEHGVSVQTRKPLR